MQIFEQIEHTNTNYEIKIEYETEEALLSVIAGDAAFQECCKIIAQAAYFTNRNM